MPQRPTSLTRAEISAAVQRTVGLSSTKSAALVDAIMDQISEALGRGENVKITKFGTFMLNDKEERTGRNPRNGKEYVIAPRRVVTFRASETLRDRVAGAPASSAPKSRT